MNIFIFSYKQGRKSINEEVRAESKIKAVQIFMKETGKKLITNLVIQAKYGQPYPKQLFIKT
jgi:hypothetical protein